MTERALVIAALAVVVWGASRLYGAWRASLARHVDVPPLSDAIADPNAVRTWVVFTTPTCSRCEPVKQRIMHTDPSATLVEIDVTARPELADRYHVRVAPTVLLAGPGGEVKARFVGLVGSQALAAAAAG